MNRYHVAFTDAPSGRPGPALFVEAHSPTDALDAALFRVWGGAPRRTNFDLLDSRDAPKTGTVRCYANALGARVKSAPSAFWHFTVTEISAYAIGESGALCPQS